VVDLAGPILVLPLVQLVAICLFVTVVVYPFLGRDYDAAVISAGYTGMALGATSTVMANMTEVTKKFGGSSKAFTVVPLAGVFFLYLVNALVVQLALPLLE
jgi:ESS family glutamate:Na+ symporter